MNRLKAFYEVGHRLFRQIGLSTKPPRSLVEQDHRDWGAPVGPSISTSNWTHCNGYAERCAGICFSESRKHFATKILSQIPTIGPIRTEIVSS
jgi:hypothetical protein